MHSKEQACQLDDRRPTTQNSDKNSMRTLTIEPLTKEAFAPSVT
jgi:hypothetical protein